MSADPLGTEITSYGSAPYGNTETWPSKKKQKNMAARIRRPHDELPTHHNLSHSTPILETSPVYAIWIAGLN